MPKLTETQRTALEIMAEPEVVAYPGGNRIKIWQIGRFCYHSNTLTSLRKRGLVKWAIQNGWSVYYITPLGREYIEDAER